MIEEICIKIIQELGATGVLIVGIFAIQYYATKKICKALHNLNHKTEDINLTLLQIGAFLQREIHGKVGRDAEHSERTS